jgi:hypothetical protein
MLKNRLTKDQMSTESKKNVEKNKDLNKNIHLKIVNFFIS